MKQITTFLMLLVALTVPWATPVQAQSTLTVADGTSTSSHVPVYGYYADEYLRCQILYPATDLADMAASSITGLTFYASENSVSWGSASFEVKITEIAASTLSGFDESVSTLVYSGPLSITNGQMSVTLTVPYIYSGGNLLMEVDNVSYGDWVSSTWLGVNASGASYQGHSSTSVSSVNPTARNFIPKTTFTYMSAGTDFCYPPTSLTASDITTTSITINVTGHANSTVSNFVMQYKLASASWDDDNAVTEVAMSGLSEVVSGLSPATTYSFRVRNDCGADNVSPWRMLDVATECDIITAIPWSESFDAMTSFGNCWGHMSFSPSFGQYPQLSSYYPNPDGTSGQSAYFYTYYGAQFLITPEFDDLASLSVGFYAMGSSGGTIKVGTIDSLADTSTFSPLQTITFPGSSNWQYYEVPLTAFTGTSGRVAFRFYSSGYGACYIDEVAIVPTPSCDRPTAVSVRNVTDVDAELIIVDASFNGNYSVLVYSEGVQVDSIAATDTVVNLSGLTANTPYTVRVLSNCDDGTRTTPSTISFRTACVSIAAADLPWTESFDSADASLSCWTLLNVYSAYSPGISSSYSHSGTHSMSMYASTFNPAQVAALPLFEDDLSGLMLTFWLRPYTNYSGNVVTDVEVGYLPNPADASSFVSLQTCTPDDNSWTEFEVTFPASASGLMAFRYHGTSAYNDIYIDDVTVQELPNCVAPASLSATNVTTTTATIVVDDPNETNDYWLYLSANDSVLLNSDSYDLTDLTPGTLYTISVRTNCPDGLTRATSVTFMTNLESIELPYATGFEAGEDSVWTLVNGTNAWALGSATSSGSSRALYISNDNGTSNSYNNGSSTVSYAIRALNLESAGEHAYSFDWKGNGEENYDYLRAWLAPGTPAVVANQLPDGTTSLYDYINTTPTGWTDLANGQMRGSSNWQTQDGTINIADEGIYCLVFMWVNDGSFGSNPPAAVDNVVFMRNSCARPDAIVVDSTDTENIYIHWNAVEGVSEYALIVNGEVLTTSDTSFIIDNLTSNTAYFITLRSVCGSDDTSMTISTSARTSCGVLTAPYNEDFSVNPLDCWTIYDFDGEANSRWYYSEDGYARSSYNEYSNANEWLITPAIAIPSDMSNLTVKWDASGSSFNSDYSHLTVRLSTTGIDTASFTTVLSAGTLSDGWETFTVQLSDTMAGHTVRVAFIHDSYNDNGPYVDNVSVYSSVYPRAAVSGPTSLVQDDTATFTATLLEGDANGLTYTWTSTLGNTLVPSDSTVFYTATTSGEDTLKLVVTNNYGSDTVFIYINVCGTITTLPWTEDFESYSTDPFSAPCWNTVFGSGSAVIISTSARVHAGVRSLRFNGYAQTPSTLVLPPFATDISQLELSFWCVAEGDNSGTLRVGYITNPADTTTFVQTLAVPESNTSYAQFEASFAGAPSGARIAIQQVNPGSNMWWWIDDLDVHQLPSCARPSSVAVSDIDETTATVTITDANNADHYSLVLRSGATVIDSTVITATTHTYSTLSPNTEYTISVRTICDDGTLTAATAATFRTPCGVEAMPWSEDFDNWTEKSPCWSFLSGNYNGGNGPATAYASAWTLSSSYGNYITLDGNVLGVNIYSSNKYWAVTPVISINSDSALLSVSVAASAWSAATPNFDGDDTLAFAISHQPPRPGPDRPQRPG